MFYIVLANCVHPCDYSLAMSAEEVNRAVKSEYFRHFVAGKDVIFSAILSMQCGMVGLVRKYVRIHEKT